MTSKKFYFMTGNKNKFNEIKQFFPDIEQIDFDLPEIQELDAKKIIEEKLKEAIKNNNARFFCEDVSLYINSLNSLPGPLVKWFLKSIGNRGIWELVKNKEDKSAIAKSIIGYTNGKDILFFEGETKGEIVEPIEGGYGWDPIFKPKGNDKTFSQMTSEIRDMRKQALIKLKNYLEEND